MRKRAFTLLEVMIGVSLLSLIAISVLPAISFSFKSRETIERKKALVMEAERIIERTKANYFEDGNISLESNYDYNIESYSEELSNKYKLKLIDGDISYEIIFYLPKDKSIYSNWTFVGSFSGTFTFGSFYKFYKSLK